MAPIIVGITNQFGMAPGLMKCVASIVRRMISSVHNSHLAWFSSGPKTRQTSPIDRSG
jgi:hypothetical protein